MRIPQWFGPGRSLWYLLLGLAVGTGCNRRHRVELAIEQQLPSVSVEVGGQRYPLMLDLGDARALTLAPDIVARERLSFTGGAIESMDAMGNIVLAREFEVEAVHIGSFDAGPQRGFEDVQDPSYPSPNPFGSVGRAIFGTRGALVVDYPRRRLEILAEAPALGRCIPLEAVDHGLVSRIPTEQGPLRILWDTGAQSNVIRSPGSDPEAQSVVHRQLGLPGGSESVAFVEFGFEQPPVDAYLGFDFFAEHAVLFDFRRSCVVVDPEL